MDKTKGAQPMPKADTSTSEPTVFKAPPRRLRMAHPATPPPAPSRPKTSDGSKKS